MKKKSKQPYRLWFEYLQTCLNHNELSKKVDREFYRSWNLNKVKTLKFDEWFKTHSHLFEEYDSNIKLFSSGKRTPNTILVEIPTNYNVHKIQKEIGGIVSNKINKPNARFAITSNRSLQTAPLDYFHWCWKWRQMDKYSNKVNGALEMIWELLNKRVTARQLKYKKATSKGTIKRRGVMGGEKSTSQKGATSGRSVIVHRNITKCNNILLNVCKGQFPGLNYSDN